MKLLLWVFGGVVLLAIGLVVGGVLLNRLPLTEPPGLVTRLATYLQTHVAETRVDHPFAELRSREFSEPPEELYAQVLSAIEGLGWTMAWTDPNKQTVAAIVATPLWRFKDDLKVSLAATAGGGTVVNVHSSSRMGAGDLGSNERHVLDLYEALESSVKQSP